MKNFSTITTRLAAAALVSCLVAGPVQAATTCAFKPDAPDQHLVVKGDTLWGISGAFLEHPWCWPQVWGLNRDEIRNPHWIYPGQIVYFDRKNGRLSLRRPGTDDDGSGIPVTRLSPQVRTEASGRDAIRSIPSGAIEPFLTEPLIVEADELANAPRIAAAQEESRVYLATGDKAYVRGDLKGNKAFQVFRPGAPLKDTDTGKVVAYEAVYLGTVALTRPAGPNVDVSTFTVTKTAQEMSVGDLLVPAPPAALINYVPHAPERTVAARVLSIYSGVTYAGQSQIVSVNRGTVDGLDVGAVLQLYHFGKTIADPGSKGIFGNKKSMRLPDEEYGDLFIFRTFKNVSYGLIMQVTVPVEVGDVAKSPE
jgi:hypothetical protein